MDANAWIALAGLAVVVIGQLIAYAFLLGGVFARLKRVEADQTASQLLIGQVSALNATMGGFKDQLQHFSDTMRDLLVARETPARRPRTTG